MKSIQLLEGGDITSLPALQGPILIEVEAGHVIDLTQAFEWHDDPKSRMLLLLFPGESIERKLPGPHGVAISGRARKLALKYLAHQLERSRSWLESL